jgi:chromosome segregation ATPase
MSKKYENEIRRLELEGRLHGQEQSRKRAEAEILTLKGRIEDLEVTITTLDTAIIDTNKLLDEINQ